MKISWLGWKDDDVLYHREGLEYMQGWLSDLIYLYSCTIYIVIYLLMCEESSRSVIFSSGVHFSCSNITHSTLTFQNHA